MLAVACGGKGAGAGDSTDEVIDVSDLQCAGLEWSENGVDTRVPTTTSDGCDGGRAVGALTCDGNGCGINSLVEVDVGGYKCSETEVAADGTFDTGTLAPYSDYWLHFDGYLTNGEPGGWSYDFSVCADDVVITAFVSAVPVDSGS